MSHFRSDQLLAAGAFESWKAPADIDCWILLAHIPCCECVRRCVSPSNPTRSSLCCQRSVLSWYRSECSISAKSRSVLRSVLSHALRRRQHPRLIQHRACHLELAVGAMGKSASCNQIRVKVRVLWMSGPFLFDGFGCGAQLFSYP